MESFEKTIEVKQEDLDDLQHVNNVRYLEWIQDISKEHWERNVSEQVRNKVVWVVSSHYIQYKGEAKLGDRIQIKTYIADTKGAISIRAVEMRLESTGKLILQSKTEWCLLDAEVFKPMRISEEIRSFFKSNS